MDECNEMYISNTQNLKPISEGYKQTFQNKFTSSVAKNEVIKMKNEGVLTDRDLEIAKFLFKFRFATLEQIYEYLKHINMLTQKPSSEGEEPVETAITSIKSRLDKLVKNRILNKFMLGRIEENNILPDALVIYCLDLGGKYLLTNYSNEDTSDWFITVNYKASNLISKDIFTTQFYLKLISTCGDRIKYFEINPLRKCEKNNIIPSFEFCIEYLGKPRYCICEVVRDFDLPTYFTKKIEKLERLVETNAWRKYCYDSNTPPVIFFFAESDLSANDIGRIVANSTVIGGYRLSTDERINGDLSKAFMQYIKETGKLKISKANMF